MRTSEAINELSKAMAAAQGAMKPAVKDATNPHFKSKYADLASVFEAIREPLSKNGLSVWQELGNYEGGVTVTTRILHSSGQWVEFGPLAVPAGKQDAQGLGSAATYARRYGLASALGVCADEDDDGNAAAHSGNGNGNGGGKPLPPKPMEQASWTIKANGSADFVAKFCAKMDKAPTLNAVTKLSADNKAHIDALSDEEYRPVHAAIEKRTSFLGQAPAREAAE